MYPDNGSPYGVLASGAARTEMVLTNLLDDKPTLLLDDSADVIAAEVAAIKADRKLAEARAKLQAAEMGGAATGLSGDETRLIRALLADAINYCDSEPDATHHDGRPIDAALCAALRKCLNATVVRNCERRTGGAA